MKLKLLYIAFLVLLTACSDDHLPSPTYTVGEADNAIVLRAGISEGGAGVMTRAVGSESHHTTPGHKLFTKDTKAALRIDGDWWKSADATSGELISKPTTATIGDKSANEGNGLLHNSLSMSPQLYWDDYGTADPNNTADGKGRKKGLTIFGAAVNGETTAPIVSNWKELSWNVGSPTNNIVDQSGTNGWKAVDLLTSNNIQEVNNDVPYSTDGTYKFDDRTSGKLLEFTHAMSKITVNLTAGEGFTVPTNGSETTFKESVSVALLSFNYMGKVDIEGKISTATKADGNVPTENETAVTANIKAKLMQGGKDAHTAKFEALVFPGNQFTANIANDTYNTPTSNDEILMINADGNIYMVTAAQLVKAIANGATGFQTGTLEQGKNYVLNITVNKTDIDVTATIKDWEYVAAANEAPVINIAEAYGHIGNDFEKNFDLYRCTTVDGSYISGITEGNHRVVTYVAAAGTDPVVPAHYDLNTPMYWPNHSTHYFFRGIWPLVGDNNQTNINETYTPVGKITDKSSATSIAVENVAYKTGSFPSDLMIGIPRKNNGEHDETCKVASHDKSSGANGICATEGKIRMNFQYAMSQVIVNLTTSEGDSKVIFDANTKVEIIGGYTQGEIKLSDESSDFTGKTVTDYTMHREGSSDIQYHDAIIPQSLQDGSGKATLKFRITVKSGDTYDKYETVLGIKDIKVTEDNVQKNITAWEPGKKYTYTLNITKSGVKVEATLKNWITVSASEDVWF